jgi:hypothetical protein
MSIMVDDEKVEVLANTEIEKLTRLTKYYRLRYKFYLKSEYKNIQHKL